jgi:hypothetical protein
MDLELTSGLLLLGTAVPIAVGLARYAWRNRSLPGVRPFLFLAPLCTIWALSLAIELVVPTLADKLVFSNLQFLGICFLPVATLATAIDYSGRKDLLTRRAVLLACLVPVVTQVLTWTKDGGGNLGCLVLGTLCL